MSKRLFENEEKLVTTLPPVEPGKNIVINDVPFIGNITFTPAIIQYQGNIPNPLYNKKSDSVRHYYNRENPKRQSKDKLKINLRNFFEKYPKLFTDENLDLPLGKFILKLKQEGNEDYKLFVHSYGDEEEYVSFKIKNLPDGRGLYMWVIDNTPKYIGIASGKNGLKGRINNEYGSITPYKCNIDGHTQTCRSNIKLRDEYNANKSVALYISPIDPTKYFDDPKFMELISTSKGTLPIKNALEVFEKFIIDKGNFKDGGWNRRMEEGFVKRLQKLAGIN